MEFTFETTYDQKAIRAMAEGMRKTIRKKKNRRSRIFGWVIVGLALLLMLPVLRGEEEITIRKVVTGLAAIIMVVTLLFEDAINAYFAKRRMMAGTDFATAVFNEEKYISTTEAGKTEWKYENIEVMAENPDYFIFVFDMRYAQVYDKRRMTGGSVEEFRAFLSGKTGKEIYRIS